MSDVGGGPCPSGSTLRSFALGELSESRLERVARHAADCDACEEELGRHDDERDPVLDGLRTLGGEPARERVPDALLEAARRAGGCELVPDPGRRIDRLLTDGPYRIGDLLLIEKLGAGSFGHVFKARDTALDRTVAVKVQRAGPLGGDEERERFLREARSAAQLEHPGVVTLHAAGETEDGARYLVTEYVEGETLEELLRQGRPPHREAARLIARIARALHYAHEHGVVHRDVKPSNVLIGVDGEPRVADFGLAKRDAGEATVTPEGAVLGTPAYMSPELARGEGHHVDARTDVYSLGVLLYEAITGERPFQGTRRMLVLQAIEDEPRPPRRLDHQVPADLETVCLKAMAKEPHRRYASAGALADDLERSLRGEPIAARPPRGLERLWRWSRQNRPAASLLLAVVLGAGFGFWHLSRLSTELVHGSAIDSAAQYSEMLEVVNDLYSSEVVEQLGDHGIEVTADYAAKEAAVPLPATLLTVLVERIGRGETGMRGRHYSEYPFAGRQDGGPRTEFEWAALRHLEASPDEPYYRFIEDEGGQPALVYATARRMQASCVACHNNNPASPKRDWAVGDVRGVLQIVRPLDRDIERTRAGLRTSFLLVGAVSVLGLGLSAALFVAGDRARRRRLAPREERA